MFKDKAARNKWIVDYKARMAKNITNGVTNATNSLFEAQDNYYVLEPSNYAVSHQSGNTISYTEIGDDGLPTDMHFEIGNVDVEVEDLVVIF